MRKSHKLNASEIKILVLITMFINHAVDAFSLLLPWYLVTLGEMIGGITFPVLAYFLVMGFYNTSNVRRYILRIMLFWIVSIIPFYLLHDSFVINAHMEFTDIFNNVFFTLLCALIMMYLLSKSQNIILKILIVILCILATCFSDWAIVGVLVVLLDYIFYQKKCGIYVAPLFISCYILCYGIFYYQILGFSIVNPNWIYSTFARTCGYASSVFILKKCDYEAGKPNSIIKWGSYIFYPAHLLFLWFIAKLVL